MSQIVIRTKHWPEAKGSLPDYWMAWANGVQGDGISEQDAIENARIALENGASVDPGYVE